MFEQHEYDRGFDGWDGVRDLTVKFDRSAVQGLVSTGENVELTVTGNWNAVLFRGSDGIRVIQPGNGLQGQDIGFSIPDG